MHIVVVAQVFLLMLFPVVGVVVINKDLLIYLEVVFLITLWYYLSFKTCASNWPVIKCNTGKSYSPLSKLGSWPLWSSLDSWSCYWGVGSILRAATTPINTNQVQLLKTVYSSSMAKPGQLISKTLLYKDNRADTFKADWITYKHSGDISRSYTSITLWHLSEHFGPIIQFF